MSEEEYYRDIVEEEEEPKKDYEEEWPSEPAPPEKQYPEEPYQQPYQQEYYDEGYYQEYEYYGERPEAGGPPWFLIGLLVGAGVSVVIMLIFNFVGTASRPGLAYIEIVFLLISCTLPGLFVRKVGKGILGGMIIFALQFFIPLIVFYASGKNPAAFFSPYFVFLNALGILRLGLNDLFGFTFIPDLGDFELYYAQYEKYMTFIWVFDLLIMFGIMITLVIASSWLFGNFFTGKVKSFWTWCLLPCQVITIITTLIIVPWVLLCSSSTVQMAGSLAAGFGNVMEGSSFLMGGELSDFGELDPGNITKYLDRADEWFEIARSNYRGLNSLLFIRILRGLAGRYGPVVTIANHSIYAGFELLDALQPIAHGLFDNENETGVEVNGLFYQYGDIMEVMEEFEGMFGGNITGGDKPSETDLGNLETQVGELIVDVEYLIDKYFHEALLHALEADKILSRIDPNELRNVGGQQSIEEALNMVADVLENVTTISSDYRILLPLIVDLLDQSPHLFRAILNTFVGNVRLFLGYQFANSQTYLANATTELGYVSEVFTPEREAEVAGVETAEGFYHFFEDIIDLIIPVISEERYFAGAFDGIINALDEFVDENTEICTLNETDFNQMYAYTANALSNTSSAVAEGTIASSILSDMETKANNEEYGLMNNIAMNLTGMIGGYFQPEQYAQLFDYMTLAINSTFGATHQVALNNSVGVIADLDNAENHIGNAIAIVEADPESPIYALRDFLIQFQDGIQAIKQAVIDAGGLILSAVPFIENAIETLWTEIHTIIDEGLPP